MGDMAGSLREWMEYARALIKAHGELKVLLDSDADDSLKYRLVFSTMSPRIRDLCKKLGVEFEWQEASRAEAQDTLRHYRMLVEAALKRIRPVLTAFEEEKRDEE